MAEIRESRSLKIKDRIISRDDLLKLAEVVYSEYKKSKKGEHKSIKFVASCEDGSSFESEDPSLFKESPLTSKRITRVRMDYYNYVSGRRLSIEISHEDNDFLSSYDNRVNLEGEDSKWVNGTLKSIEEIIEGFKPQSTIVKKNRWLLTILLGIGIGALAVYLIIAPLANSLSSSTSQSDTTNYDALIKFVQAYPFTLYVIKYLFFEFFGFFPALFLVDKLCSLWPTVEIQVGPSHKLIEKRRRGWLGSAIVIGVIPLIIQLLYDLFKGFLVGGH